jgi:hypothetical protein
MRRSTILWILALISVTALFCFLVTGTVFYLYYFGNLADFRSLADHEAIHSEHNVPAPSWEQGPAIQPVPEAGDENLPPAAQANPEAEQQIQPDPEAKPQLQPDPEADPEHIDIIVTPTGTLIAPVTFNNSDCTCGDYHVSRANGGELFLICQYDGSGGVMDNTQLDLSISQQYTVDNLKKSFAEDLASLHRRADNSSHNGQNYSQSTIQNDDSGFSYVETTSFSSGGQIGWCGEGNGVFILNNAFQVKIDLRSCKLATTPKGYAEEMENLESCARAITQRMSK